MAYVARRNAKLVLAGDAQQLQAVENGGGMSLLARRLGYAPAGRAGQIQRGLGARGVAAVPRR